ncbi:MAG: hypothetical protein KGI11_08555 [Thaumarchaeota archaeon]|nr:hypothetical protein [Nitrososphaerota archaeon]
MSEVYSIYTGEVEDDQGQKQWAEAMFWHSCHDIDIIFQQYEAEDILNALDKVTVEKIQHALERGWKATGVGLCSLLKSGSGSDTGDTE